MLEEKIEDAIRAELKRQAAQDQGKLTVNEGDGLEVSGKIDIVALAAAVAGAVAGGP
ncbi:MAG TPA: hypothetical protein VGO22_20005 [Pseudorhizobium sp.]|jgi:hypothetical protein|nr:hypothetical protein [Pseudorhizobium sp.]